MKEDKGSWVNFFQWLRSRDLDGVKLVVGDKCLDILETVIEVSPETKCQQYTVLFYQNVFVVTLRPTARLMVKIPKVIHTQERKKSLVIKPTLW